MFRDWFLEVEISVQAAKPDGGILVQFTDQVCGRDTAGKEGLMIWVNNSNVDMNGYSEARLHVGQQLKDGRLKLWGQKTPAPIQINKTGNHVRVMCSGEVVFDEQFRDVMAYGFFSITGISGQLGSECAVHAIRVIPLSSDERDIDLVKESKRSRKAIDILAKERQRRKHERRNRMKVTKKYLDEIASRQSFLDASDVNLRDTLRVISESLERSRDFVTADQLKNFINSYVQLSSAKALIKVEQALEECGEIKSQTQELYSRVKSHLLDLRRSLTEAMKVIENESTEKALSLKINIKKKQAMKRLEESVLFKDTPRTMMSFSLYVIMLLETVVYVIFFFYKRSKTSGFKKID